MLDRGWIFGWPAADVKAVWRVLHASAVLLDWACRLCCLWQWNGTQCGTGLLLKQQQSQGPTERQAAAGGSSSASQTSPSSHDHALPECLPFPFLLLALILCSMLVSPLLWSLAQQPQPSPLSHFLYKEGCGGPCLFDFTCACGYALLRLACSRFYILLRVPPLTQRTGKLLCGPDLTRAARPAC